MAIFFTSDTHFNHKNIITFVNRPFETVEQMNHYLIKIWNDTVSKHDIIYHLGDFGFGSEDELENIISQLNGKIILVKGNHDNNRVFRKLKEKELLYEYHEMGLRIRHNKHKLYLTHYPLVISEKPKQWSIHGHVHGQESPYKNHLNVCLDSYDLKDRKPFGKPIGMDELMNMIEQKKKRWFHQEVK